MIEETSVTMFHVFKGRQQQVKFASHLPPVVLLHTQSSRDRVYKYLENTVFDQLVRQFNDFIIMWDNMTDLYSSALKGSQVWHSSILIFAVSKALCPLLFCCRRMGSRYADMSLSRAETWLRYHLSASQPANGVFAVAPAPKSGVKRQISSTM